MNKNLTELVVVLDRSGSMAPVANDAIGGFNTFLEAQKAAPGEARITVTQFNTDLEHYALNADVKSVAPLTRETYRPSGNTALYDAIGTTIDQIGEKLSAMTEADRPEKVIFAILTDGEENSSREYSGAKIKSMIARQRDTYNWDFVFLAAGEGAIQEGNNIGMIQTKMMRFANTGDNQKSAYETLSMYAVNSRSMSTKDYQQYSATVDLQSAFTQATNAAASPIPTGADEASK